MTKRYFAKVVSIIDRFTIVINVGSNEKIQIGDKYLVIGLGETIVDPDTQEELERLEIIRGKASVTHIQEKIATLHSYEYEYSPDEITTVAKKKDQNVATPRSRSMSIFGFEGGDVTETTTTTKPGVKQLKALSGVSVGDFVIKL
jgi:flagellar biogenesis protein FliO